MFEEELAQMEEKTNVKRKGGFKDQADAEVMVKMVLFRPSIPVYDLRAEHLACGLGGGWPPADSSATVEYRELFPTL
jgi:hypothetical protein